MIKENLLVNFEKYNLGVAISSLNDKKIYTLKENLILGKEATVKEEEADRCRKKVLNKYCLGGDVADLPEPNTKEGKNFIYHDGERQIFIAIINQRIASVSILDPSPSWLNYRTLLHQLEKKYDKGFNADDFPQYAKSDSSKATAIRLGEGRALTIWAYTGWSIHYGWAHKKWRVLTYKHENLSKVLDQEKIDLL